MSCMSNTYSPHQRICIDTHHILSSPLNMRAHIEHIYNTYTRFCESIQIYSIYHAYYKPQAIA
jgi:hypothetical protein